MRSLHFMWMAGWTAGVLAVTGGATATTQPWPEQKITVVSPFSAGTTYDLVARLVLDQVTLQMGQPFVIQDRPGKDGATGIESVINAAPDGYTLLLDTSAISTATILHKSLPYDTLHDLQPVAMFGGQPSMLLAAPKKGYSSVDALVAAAKANPGKLKFASVGIGSASHLAAERFRLVAGLNVQSVVYPEPVDAFNDLTDGRVDFYFVPIPPALALAVHGKVVPLAVSTLGRWPLLPMVPTLAESGYPVATFLSWCGLSAPLKTPRSIVDKLNNAIGNVLALPAIQNRLQRMGFKPTTMDPDQYAQFLADDMTSTIQLGKDAKIAPTP